MRDMPETLPRPAILLKPRPSTDGSDGYAMRLGGLPRLPADIPWPHKHGTAYHFFGQINLACVHRATLDEAQLPRMPDNGTLFIFLGLQNLYSEMPPVFIHVGDALDDIPERTVPDDLVHMLDDNYELAGGIDERAVASDGKTFVVQDVDALPYRSFQAAWNGTSAEAETELERLLGRIPSLPDPHAPPEGVTAPWLSQLPARYHSLKLAKTRLDWDDLFYWCKAAYLDVLDAVEDQLKARGSQDIPPSRRPGVEEISAYWVKVNWTKHKYQFWLFYPEVFLSPGDSHPIDFRLRHYMEISQRCRGKVPNRVLRNFSAIIADLEAAAERGAMLELGLEDIPQPCTLAAGDVANALYKATDVLEPVRTGPEPVRSVPTTWEEYVVNATKLPPIERNNFQVAGSSLIPMQMFGYGYLLQHAAMERSDKVLLFQLGDPFGTAITNDQLLQVWINQDDLANARFDAIEATWEST